MNIGIIITRIGGVDGVALETEKWIRVLKRMGHRVFVLSGKLERALKDVTVLPELYLYHRFNEQEQDAAYFVQDTGQKTLMRLLDEHSTHLQKEILHWMVRNRIDCLVSQNASSLPCHLSMGMAIREIARRTSVKTVLHSHDFWWERAERYRTGYAAVRRIMRDCFPPREDNIRHVVINTYNKERLKEKLGIDATVVPNVMDFEVRFGKKDGYNRDFPRVMGLDKDHIVLSQVTRIVERKGIETAVDLVDRLDDPRVRLLITGLPTDDPGGHYYRRLVDMIKERRLGRAVKFVGKRVDHWRRKKGSSKVYSLSDVYAHTTACTYFSTYEGFGNAFVEACAARVPIFVNNYKPVYWPDIGSKGFKTVMLQGNRLTRKHVEEIKEVLTRPDLARHIAEHNFRLAGKHFSLDTLQKLLRRVFK